MEREELHDRLESDVDDLDLSRDEDLSIGIMNLISLEEHLFFTHEKTDDPEYLEMLSEVREMRARSMEEIVNDTEGEEWCISKHLLSAAMRFKETADKMLDEGRDDAERFYDRAFSLYAMFWAINYDIDGENGIIEHTDAVHDQDEQVSLTKDTEEVGDQIRGTDQGTGKGSWLENAKSVVKRAVNCCKEL
ncbi:MAG: hypothetical protein MUP66_00220 [Candidatus Nanohaloarchaeota archaeon QJJ-5]|nr:hypothetical protein [Candidatus Nanohaloarchaeota archaeon QJJ-5]